MTEVEYWLKRNLANYEKKHSPLSERDKKLVEEWLQSSYKLNNLPRISVPQALEKAKRWKNREEHQKLIKEDFISLEVVFKNHPEYHWVLLNSEQNYIREGALMNHCIGEYFVSNKNRIFSLRDKKNHPYATIEINDETQQIIQVKGPLNGIIKKELHYLVKEFVEYQIFHNNYSIPDKINSLLDLGNFEHLVYNQSIISSSNFEKLKKIKDDKVIVNNICLESFPEKVDCDLLYIRNIKNLSEISLKGRVDRLVVVNCYALEKIELEGNFKEIIIDNCNRLQEMPKKLKVNKIIINKCPKIKKVAKVLEAEECLIIKSFLGSIADECYLKKLSLFNVRLEKFADIFKVEKFYFSHLSPVNNNYFKTTPLFSCVNVIGTLNYWDTVSFYSYQANFVEEHHALRLANHNTDKFIRDFEKQNLTRLDELSFVFNYPVGFKDLYFKLIDYLKHKIFS